MPGVHCDCLCAQVDAIAAAVRLAGATLNADGRVVYVGSGTSGLLGVIGVWRWSGCPSPSLPPPCCGLRALTCVPCPLSVPVRVAAPMPRG
jgi:hypothetical protein